MPEKTRPDETPKPNILEKLSGQMGAITAIIATVVTLNTAVTTWSEQRIARHGAFREAVKAEEMFWKGLYDEYLGTFTPAIAGNADLRRAKMFAILNLANHDVPDFLEYSVGDGLKLEANMRLNDMRAALIDALQDRRAADPEVAQASQAAAWLADDATRVRSQRVRDAAETSAQAQTPPPPTAAQAPAPAALSYQTRVLALGSRTGWDVDVLWCQGPGEEWNYFEAQRLANLLAQTSTAGTVISPNAVLGRIRLRSVPLSHQQPVGDPARPFSVVWDRTADERNVASAIRQLVGGPFRLIQSNGAATTWYISVLVCRTPPANAAPRVSQAPAGRPGATGA